LKQIDKNGRFTYSNIIAVNPSNNNINSVKAYPNPVTNHLNLLIHATRNNKAALMITDITGRIVLHQQLEVIKGNQNKLVDVSQLTAGSYYLTVLLNNEKITQKIQKL
jgi:hypothetical protein